MNERELLETIIKIRTLLRTPTRGTEYKSADAHFQADMDKIRALCDSAIEN
jgi:hypothetical protein